MRAAFEAWWPSVGQSIGKVAAWEAWQAAIAADRAARAEPVAWGMPNTAITGHRNALMMVRLEIPSGDQYGGALLVPLYAAPPAAPVVPDGWKLVPVDPTESMLESARLATESEGLTTTTWLRNCVYRAMLAAAPKPEQSDNLPPCAAHGGE